MSELIPKAFIASSGITAALLSAFFVIMLGIFFINRRKLNPEQAIENDILRYAADWRTADSRPSNYASFDFAVVYNDLPSVRDSQMPTSAKRQAVVLALKRMAESGLLSGHSHMGGGEYLITDLGYQKLDLYRDSFGTRGAMLATLRALKSLVQSIIIPVAVSVIGTAVTLILGLSEKAP